MENIENNLMIDDAERKQQQELAPQDEGNDTVAENFFSQLDKQVMGETLDEDSPEPAQQTQTTSPEGNPEQQ